MSEKFVRVWTRAWDDGDSFEEDPEEPDDTYHEDQPCETDELSTAVIQAAQVLERVGCMEPSSCPGFHPGIWYSNVDGSYTSNYATGARREETAHLHGFSDVEQHQIWQLVNCQLLVT